MWKRALLSVALCTAWAAWAAAGEETLNLGDPAPKLQVKEFVKGAPVKDLEKGKTYVVEFWATWCGPCRTSIPHLTKLQKEHKDVTFIGVSVYEQDQKGVKPFVEQMGDKMEYAVAMDSVPADGKGSDGKMAKAWMEASGQEGIPAAFIVNGAGRIAWIGHPMEMEKPLGEILSGAYDLDAAVAKYKKDQVAKKKLRELQGKLAQAQQSKDPAAVLAVLDEAIADNPALEERLGLMKYLTLVKQDNAKEKAVDYGKRLVETVLKDDANSLNNLAWVSMDTKDKKVDPAIAKVALMAAERADELAKGKAPEVADTLAKAYFENDQPAKALETQERAMKLAKGTAMEKDQGMKDRLAQYQKAAKQ